MKNSKIIFLALCFIFGLAACNCDLKVRFQDQTLGSKFTVGDSFTSSNLNFTVTQFFWRDGTPSSNGLLTIKNQTGTNPGSGGSFYNLNLNNASAKINLAKPAKSISLNAGYWGGNLNLKVNGVFKNFSTAADINNTTISGVQIKATGSKDIPGIWTFEGTINSFEVGGQEFFIDDICIQY